MREKGEMRRRMTMNAAVGRERKGREEAARVLAGKRKRVMMMRE